MNQKKSLSEAIKIKKMNGSDIIIEFAAAPSGNKHLKCALCLRRRKTNLHHIVPRRIDLQNMLAGRLVIRVCRECHNKLHPENLKIDGAKIIAKQDRLLARYRTIINNKIWGYYEDLVRIVDRKYNRLVKEVRGFPNKFTTKKEKKEMFAMQKLYEGRITELKAIHNVILELMRKKQQEYKSKRLKRK